MNAADVVKLEYKGQNSSMAVVKEGEIWYKDDDREFPLNQGYVGAMVSTLSGLTAAKTVTEAPENLADYGLETPKVWARITDADGSRAEVRVGIQSPAGDGCYVTVNDSRTVYLATTALMTQFAYTENQMIAKMSVPAIDQDSIMKILIEKPEGNLELSLEVGNELDMTGYNPWLLRQGFPEVLPGNTDVIEEMLVNYTEFPLGDCVEYSCAEPEKYGLAEPSAVLKLVTYKREETGETDEETGEAVTEMKFYDFGMKIGGKNEAGSYYVQLEGSDAVYLMSEEEVDKKINVDAYGCVITLPGLVNIADVDQVTLDYAGGQHVMKLERSMETTVDGEGKETGEEATTYFLDDKEVEKSDFTKVYQRMIGVSIDGLADAEVAAQASGKPVLTMTYDRTGAGKKPVVVEFFEYNDNFNRISVNGSSLFRVNIRDVESLIGLFEETFS